MNLGLFIVLGLFMFNIYAGALEHGDVKKDIKGNMLIWDGNTKQWAGIESFWIDYANSKGGLTWGKSGKYPEYKKVKEFDTLLIELRQGTCLMEFFHGRWRRANDVRRWNEEINKYGSCPYVFD